MRKNLIEFEFMIVNYEQLIGLPVKTRQGRLLGKICGIDIDSESQSVVRYHIKTKINFPTLWQGKLLVARGQVVKIDRNEMIVEDDLSREIGGEQTAKEIRTSQQPATQI